LGTCFFASDLHGGVERYRKLFAAIEDERPAALFLGGDLLPRPRESAPEMFVAGVLGDGLLGLSESLGNEYPSVFLIPGNMDAPEAVPALRDLESRGLLQYAHERGLPFGEFTVYGYGCVPPTPFTAKHFERYDVGRALEPGCLPPVETDSTIERELRFLTRGDDLSRAILLFHSPPYHTRLDRLAAGEDACVGSVAVRRLIEERRPAFGLCGHVHESARISGSWRDRIGPTELYSAAHDGAELALVAFDPHRPQAAERRLL
jgi:uncharacterized protein